MPRQSATTKKTEEVEPAVVDDAASNFPEPEEKPKVKAKTLREVLQELRTTDKELWVKNATSSLVIIRNNPGSKDYFKLELKPNGQAGSIALLPKEALRSTPFQNMWMKRKVVISDDETMEDELLLLMTGEVERQVKPTVVGWDGESITPQLVRPPTDNSIVFQTDDEGSINLNSRDKKRRACLLTGEPVFQTQRQIDAGEPPLADHVKDKAYLFPGQQRVDDQGQAYWVFPKVAIGMDG